MSAKMSCLVFECADGHTRMVRHSRHFELSKGDVVVDYERRVFVVSKERTTDNRQTIWFEQTAPF